jgi:hypothetical protein
MRLVTPTSEAMEAELRKSGLGYRIDSPEVQKMKAEQMYSQLKKRNELWKDEDWSGEPKPANRNRPIDGR